jgi:hypothetical protein
MLIWFAVSYYNKYLHASLVTYLRGIAPSIHQKNDVKSLHIIQFLIYFIYLYILLYYKARYNMRIKNCTNKKLPTVNATV